MIPEWGVTLPPFSRLIWRLRAVYIIGQCLGVVNAACGLIEQKSGAKMIGAARSQQGMWSHNCMHEQSKLYIYPEGRRQAILPRLASCSCMPSCDCISLFALTWRLSFERTSISACSWQTGIMYVHACDVG